MPLPLPSWMPDGVEFILVVDKLRTKDGTDLPLSGGYPNSSFSLHNVPTVQWLSITASCTSLRLSRSSVPVVRYRLPEVLNGIRQR